MNKKQEQMAKDAQKANESDMTMDELFDYICESAIKESQTMREIFRLATRPLADIYSEYAKQINQPSLTKEDKSLAFLNHVLEQGKQKIPTKNDEFITETEKDLQEFGDAWEKFKDAIYAEIEPLVKKLAELLDKIT